jgi:hypothetical protein
MFKNPTSLDKNKLHLKYIVSYNHATKQFFVATMPSYGFHSDGHIPTGFRLISAGYFSAPKSEFIADDFTNAETWGGSEGFQIGTKERDLAMLKQHMTDGTNTYDEHGQAVDSLA